MATGGFPPGAPRGTFRQFAPNEYIPPGTSMSPPKNLLWLNTYYITLPTTNILALQPGQVLASDIVSFRNVSEIFMFEIVMCPDYHLATFICRFQLAGLNVPKDDGFVLMCNFSVVGFTDQPPISVALSPGQDVAYAMFSIVSALRRFRELGTLKYVFDIKIVVKMVEYHNLPGEAYDEQEKALKKLRKKMSRRQIKELGELLDSPGLVDVFTGRANSNCAQSKLEIIGRTATYSRKILDYLNARKKPDWKYPEEFNYVISYLITGEKGQLSEVDTLLAYLLGHTTFIPYLITMTRDYILSQLDEEVSMLVEALQLSNHVEDRGLFEVTAVKFLERMQEVEECETFKAIKEQTPWVARAIIHAVTVFMKTRAGWIPGWKPRAKSEPETTSEL